MAEENERRLIVPPDYPWQNVSTILSDKDGMFGGTALGANEHYFYVGVSALDSVNAALKAAGINNVAKILDMPCGYGRVTRTLRAAYPTIELSVSDLDLDAVEFCKKQFDCKSYVSSAEFSTLNFGTTFDLIWVGSLITHLPASVTSDFITFVLRHLPPEGAAVVSSHGAMVIERFANGFTYGIDDEGRQRIISDYYSHGYGYSNYATINPSGQRYGISLISRDWLLSAIAKAGGRVLFYNEKAWGRHHDIVSFVRAN
jgi:SAM-dependent methyltransferase